MMTIEETRDLMQPIFALDGRKLTPEVISLWHSVLEDYVTLKDALTVTRQWLKENDGLIKPANINAMCKKLRKSRLPSTAKINDALAKAHAPAELDMPQAKQRLYRRLGDGVELDKAIQDTISELPQLAAKRAKPEITSKPHAPRATPIIGQSIPQK